MAREGLPFAGTCLLAALLCGAAAGLHGALIYAAAAFGVLTLFMVFFFRDPERTPPAGEHLIVSAADGRVVRVGETEQDDYIGGAAQEVSIFLSPLNVHVNRVPLAGVVDFVRWQRGRFLAAFSEAASAENEQTVIGIRSGSAQIVVKQIVGVLARRVVCRLQAGDTVDRGARFGLIRFGSRVDLIVPGSTQIQVAVGDRVRGGETVMGVLP